MIRTSRLVPAVKAVALLLGVAAFLASPAAEAARPNVLLVMTDDQGYGDLSCHGNPIIETPALDKLHADSVRLTNYHVDPTCSPTRSALMTGRYSTRTGVWHTIAGRSMMRPAEVTVADVFQRNGYTTGCFGKWHLGDTPGLHPWERGFDVSLVHGGGGVTQTPDFWGNDYFDDVYQGSPSFNGGADYPKGRLEQFNGYCTDIWFEQAWRFIERAERETDEPWFCYIATNAPHGPYIPPEGDRDEELKRSGLPQSMANFYTMVENIDANMGQMLTKLSKAGIAKDTLVIFTTDNGTAAGVATKRGGKGKPAEEIGFSAGLRAKKGSNYEGGHRVPCFWRWPAGDLDGGVDVDTLTAHIDVLPTLADLCGLKAGEHPEWDGTSIKSLLDQSADADFLRDRTLVVHSQRIEDPVKERNFAVMTDQYRYCTGGELYDIKADLGQKNNIASSNPDVVSELKAAYDAWWESLSPSFDTLVRIEFDGAQNAKTEFTCHDWHPTGPGRFTNMVPWNQGMIKQDPEARGWFAVRVAEAGKYRIRGRMRPTGNAYYLPAGTASLKLGPISESAAVKNDSLYGEFTVDLPAGEHRMEFSFDDGTKNRGFYYIDVRRL